MEDVDMGTNLVEAIFIGISSGASATGINQVGKQLNKDDC
jgi:cysteine synthase